MIGFFPARLRASSAQSSSQLSPPVATPTATLAPSESSEEPLVPLRVALPPSQRRSPGRSSSTIWLSFFTSVISRRRSSTVPTRRWPGCRRAAEVLELDVLAVELPAERFQLPIEEACPHVLEGDLERVEVVVRGDVRKHRDGARTSAGCGSGPRRRPRCSGSPASSRTRAVPRAPSPSPSGGPQHPARARQPPGLQVSRRSR